MVAKKKGVRRQGVAPADVPGHSLCFSGTLMQAQPERDPFLEHFLPGDTTPMRSLRATISLANRRYRNPPRMGRSILLVGESGVGKNHIARVIAGHLYWLRDSSIWQPPQPGGASKTIFQVTAENFAEVSLPNVPTELVESELFGHVKGAFTGATSEHYGYFGAEHVEDLLLDEVGEASAALQAKLLQVLNDGSYKRVGADPSESDTTHARIFLATNRDLAGLVRAGKFRKDLYWRIQHIVIRIPPLREQSDRIPVLAEDLVTRIVCAHEISPSLRLSRADIEWAKLQAWPGNVRELERLLWRWVYEEGRLSLERIQAEYPEEDLDSPAASSVKELIRRRLLDALDMQQPVAESVGAFARTIEQETQRSLYELKAELDLDRRRLAVLFGDGDGAAKQISAWGKSVRSR